MPRDERQRVLLRIAELRSMLRQTTSADVRETLRQAIADCETKLAELDAIGAAGSATPERQGR
jgi:hypothetical protein